MNLNKFWSTVYNYFVNQVLNIKLIKLIKFIVIHLAYWNIIKLGQPKSNLCVSKSTKWAGWRTWSWHSSAQASYFISILFIFFMFSLSYDCYRVMMGGFPLLVPDNHTNKQDRKTGEQVDGAIWIFHSNSAIIIIS